MRLTIVVSIEALESAIECLKTRSMALHSSAAHARDAVTAQEFRLLGDDLDKHAEELRRAQHGYTSRR